MEKLGNLSDCEPETRLDVSVVPDVSVVRVSPSSVVTESCEGFSFCSDWEFVEPQACSSYKKRAHSWTVTQEDMRFEDSQAKAPPPSRRTMPPTPLQNSYSSFEEEQGHFEVEGQTWSARDRTFKARTKEYPEEGYSKW